MIVSLVAVLLIGAIAWSGAVAGFQSLLGVALPLLADRRPVPDFAEGQPQVRPWEGWNSYRV